MKLVIEGRMPGLNDYIRAMNRSRWSGNSMKADWTEAVELMARVQRLGRCDRRQDIHFLWVEENGRRDKDNIAFAKKFILDGLVKAGVLPDDGWRWVGRLSDEFVVDKERPRVEVTLTDSKGGTRWKR